jgi:hypothetical protein
MKDPKNLLKIIRRTYNKYTKYTQKQLKATQIDDSNVYKKTRFSLLGLGTKTIIIQNRDQNVILPKLDQTVNT